MVALRLPNIAFGILVSYINPPSNTSPNKLKPYNSLNLVQPVIPTPSFASIPQQPQQELTPIAKSSSDGGKPRKREPKTRHPNQLQLLQSRQSLLLHVLCVMLLVMPPIIVMNSLLSGMWYLIPFLILTFLRSMSPTRFN